MKDLHVVGYPTFIVMNADGAVLNRWIGYDKNMFTGKVEATLADPTSIEEKLARYHAQPTSEGAAALADYHGSRGEYADAVTLYRQAERLNRDPAMDYRLEIFEGIFYGARGEQFDLGDLVKAADDVLASANRTPQDLNWVARLMTYYARKVEKPPLAKKYLAIAVMESEDSTDEEVLKGRRRILPDYALLVLDNEAKAVAYKKKSLPEGWMEDAGELNGFAWWCFENRINLHEAREMAERGVRISEPGGERAAIIDTLAEICNELGDCGESVALMRRALEDDPDNEQYREQLERFEKLHQENQGG